MNGEGDGGDPVVAWLRPRTGELGGEVLVGILLGTEPPRDASWLDHRLWEERWQAPATAPAAAGETCGCLYNPFGHCIASCLACSAGPQAFLEEASHLRYRRRRILQASNVVNVLATLLQLGKSLNQPAPRRSGLTVCDRCARPYAYHAVDPFEPWVVMLCDEGDRGKL